MLAQPRFPQASLQQGTDPLWKPFPETGPGPARKLGGFWGSQTIRNQLRGSWAASGSGPGHAACLPITDPQWTLWGVVLGSDFGLWVHSKESHKGKTSQTQLEETGAKPLHKRMQMYRKGFLQLHKSCGLSA
jgi:hypothetical protein